MKNLIIILIIGTLFSCNSTGNYHDGKYKTGVFNSNMTWVRYEEIEIKGNELYYKSFSVTGEPGNEFKTSCEQFPDRVEFKAKGGITSIARFNENGDMTFGEYTYKKIKDGEEN